MPEFIPRHYDIHAWTISEARKYLDVKHQLGWRVARMVPQVGTRKIVSLFKKIAPRKEAATQN
jgi:hypothetical protein